jgi:hypothetical protein
LLGDDGTFDGAMVFVEDIAQRRAAQERLERLLKYDELTGLPRESVLAARLDQAIEASRPGRPNAVVMHLNFDGFARVKDAKKTGPGSWRSHAPALRAPVARFMTRAGILSDATGATKSRWCSAQNEGGRAASERDRGAVAPAFVRPWRGQPGRSSSTSPKPRAISAAS